jgi:hypothetical protein
VDLQSARLIVESLLQRLDADASSPGPKLIAFVSEVERAALRALLQPPVSKESTIAPIVDKTAVPQSSRGAQSKKSPLCRPDINPW